MYENATYRLVTVDNKIEILYRKGQSHIPTIAQVYPTSYTDNMRDI